MVRIFDGHIVIFELKKCHEGIPEYLDHLLNKKLGICIGDAPEAKHSIHCDFRYQLEQAISQLDTENSSKEFAFHHDSNEYRFVGPTEDQPEKEQGDDQKLPNKSAWNHLLSLVHYARAVSIKERGSKYFNSLSQNEKFLEYALLCYIRSLQLIQSLNLSSFILQSIAVHVEAKALQVLIDSCQWIDDFKLEIPLSDIYNTLPTLEFKTIMNISVCHLKRKNYDKCIKICTKALELRPAKEADETSIKPANLMKAYYRRGLCQFELGNLDEAKEDIVCCLNKFTGNREVEDLKTKIESRINEHNNMLKSKLKKNM